MDEQGHLHKEATVKQSGTQGNSSNPSPASNAGQVEVKADAAGANADDGSKKVVEEKRPPRRKPAAEKALGTKVAEADPMVELKAEWARVGGKDDGVQAYWSAKARTTVSVGPEQKLRDRLTELAAKAEKVEPKKAPAKKVVAEADPVAELRANWERVDKNGDDGIQVFRSRDGKQIVTAKPGQTLGGRLAELAAKATATTMKPAVETGQVEKVETKPAPVAVVVAESVCPECGFRMEGEANFCGKCGTTLANAGSSATVRAAAVVAAITMATPGAVVTGEPKSTATKSGGSWGGIGGAAALAMPQGPTPAEVLAECLKADLFDARVPAEKKAKGDQRVCPVEGCSHEHELSAEPQFVVAGEELREVCDACATAMREIEGEKGRKVYARRVHEYKDLVAVEAVFERAKAKRLAKIERARIEEERKPASEADIAAMRRIATGEADIRVSEDAEVCSLHGAKCAASLYLVASRGLGLANPTVVPLCSGAVKAYRKVEAEAEGRRPDRVFSEHADAAALVVGILASRSGRKSRQMGDERQMTGVELRRRLASYGSEDGLGQGACEGLREPPQLATFYQNSWPVAQFMADEEQGKVAARAMEAIFAKHPGLHDRRFKRLQVQRAAEAQAKVTEAATAAIKAAIELQKLPGVGQATAQKLVAAGICSVMELAQAGVDRVVAAGIVVKTAAKLVAAAEESVGVTGRRGDLVGLDGGIQAQAAVA